MVSKDAIVSASARFPKPALDKPFQYGTAGVSNHSIVCCTMLKSSTVSLESVGIGSAFIIILVIEKSEVR